MFLFAGSFFTSNEEGIVITMETHLNSKDYKYYHFLQVKNNVAVEDMNCDGSDSVERGYRIMSYQKRETRADG